MAGEQRVVMAPEDVIVESIVNAAIYGRDFGRSGATCVVPEGEPAISLEMYIAREARRMMESWPGRTMEVRDAGARFDA